MPMNAEQKKFWNGYLATLKDKPKNPTIEVAIPGDERNADELIELYLEGRKMASSGLVEGFKACNAPLPKVGNYWMILNSKEEPKCIVKTLAIEFYIFSEVPEKVSLAEGEGDSSIEYWRKAHKAFFKPYLQDWGIANIDEATVITEYYDVVYKG